MIEQLIIAQYMASSQNAECRLKAVNSLRHLLMDPIVFDTEDDDAYSVIYQRIMRYIEGQYPLLSWEVKRQMAKKERRRERKNDAQQKVSVHF